MARYYGAWGGANNRYRLVVDINLISQSTSGNTSYIQWIYYAESNLSVRYFDAMFDRELTVNGTKVHDVNNRWNMGSGGLREIARGNRTISHDSDGTKRLYFSGFGNTSTGYSWSFNRTISDSMVLTTIPRASVVSVAYGSRGIGDTQTIYTNWASSSFNHYIYYRYGSGSWINLSKTVGASMTWRVPESLASNVPSGTSGVVSILCYTYSGGVHIGTSTTSFTFTIPNNATFQPSASFTSLNVVSGLNGYFVQGISKINVVSSGSGKYGATISQYRITIDGSNYYGSNITSGAINKSGAVTVTLLVTDSRGFTETKTSSVTYQQYYSPRILGFTASRSPAQTGTDLVVNVNFDIATIADQNAKYYAVLYREIGGSWVTLYSSSAYYTRSTTHTASGVLDANKSYEVKMELRDSYNTTSNPIITTKPIGTVFKLMNFNASGRGIGFGKFSERDGFDFATPPMVNGVEIGGGDSDKIDVTDTRILPASSGASDYVPIPSDMPDKSVYALFTRGLTGGSWRSALILKGWSDVGYATWAITGPATTSADENFYLVSGIGSSWNPQRLIYHSGNLASSNEADVASTLALRTSSADIYARLFRSTYQEQGDISGGIAFRKSTSDNYIRFCNSPTAVMNWIGADKAITASGSNSNGYYVLFADGTQICWHYWTETLYVDNSWGSGYSSDPITRTFARRFTSYPACSVTIVNTTPGSTSWDAKIEVTTSIVKFVALRFSSLNTGMRLMFMAVGRG